MGDERRPAIYIEGNRDCYNPDQREHSTMTVAELIDCINEMGDAYGMDARVFLRNDGGYTYGSIGWFDVSFGGYNDNTAWLGEWDGDEIDL